MIISPRLPTSPLLLGVLAFVAACRTAAPPGADAPEPPTSQLNAETLLAELNPRGGAALVRAWSGTEPESVAVHYAENAVLVVDAQTVYRGRGEILDGFLRPLVGHIAGLTPTIDQVVGGREQMTLIGRFTTRVNAPGGEPSEANGVFANTWERQPDGSWKITAAINDRPKPSARAAAAPRDTAQRDRVRIVRFTVKPDQRTEFERFFREDLLTAAAKRQGVPAEELDLGGFRLLIPSAPTAQGHFTYYIIADGDAGALGTGEVMRDMVREAFPGEDGVRRVQRWMGTMVLEEPYRPVGEMFTEADLTNAAESRPASTSRDSAETATQIGRLFEEWLRAFEDGDADALAALFTDDGIYAANTGQLLRGRDGIREGVSGWIARRAQMLADFGVSDATGIDVREEIVRFRLAGDVAYTVFRFMIRVEPSGCFMDAGHGLAVWRLQNGGPWRLESLTVNRDSQAPEGACARR